jgi:hypothetical protein
LINNKASVVFQDPDLKVMSSFLSLSLPWDSGWNPKLVTLTTFFMDPQTAAAVQAAIDAGINAENVCRAGADTATAAAHAVSLAAAEAAADAVTAAAADAQAQLAAAAAVGAPPPVVGTAAAPIVAAVGVKLPAFWTARPSLWFRQAEGVFANRTPAITRDETKFNYVLKVLPNAVIEHVAAVVENPPAQDKFGAIKAALLAAFDKLDDAKKSELLSLATLGDRRPTDYLNHLRYLTGQDYAAIERAYLLNALPLSVQQVA